MDRSWQAWHRAYDDPASSLSRRLETVRAQLGRLFGELRGASSAQLLSICAGDGRDALPVLADAAPRARATLIELDPGLARAARAAARELGLTGVQVLEADAGVLATYDAIPAADVVLACGVFGNITDSDVERTVAQLPRLLVPGGRVIWTRGRPVEPDPTSVEGDPSQRVREIFATAGFVEEAYVRPDDAGFRVGVHRWPMTVPLSPVDGRRLFSFVR